MGIMTPSSPGRTRTSLLTSSTSLAAGIEPATPLAALAARAGARTLFTCGIIMVAVLLGMLFWWTITTGGLTVRQLTLFFSTFVFLQFWNMFNAKGFETRHSVFSCLRGCREFFLILLAIAVGQVLIVEFGGEVFRTEPLAWREWAVIIGSTSLIAVGGEIVRAIGRKR